MNNKQFSFLFTNLKTGQVREAMIELRFDYSEIDNCCMYQLFDGETPMVENAETPDEAIENGAWSDAPAQWGWAHVTCRIPLKIAA